MLISNVSRNLFLVSKISNCAAKNSEETIAPTPVTQPETKPVSVPAKIALAQFANVNFKGKYGRDDLSAYENYCGPKPPQIEIDKYRISVGVQEALDKGDYLNAIIGKLDLAKICKRQQKEHDAFMLENSVRSLYKDLPKDSKTIAKVYISGYNYDMAKYIDEDIKRM